MKKTCGSVGITGRKTKTDHDSAFLTRRVTGEALSWLFAFTTRSGNAVPLGPEVLTIEVNRKIRIDSSSTATKAPPRAPKRRSKMIAVRNRKTLA